MCESESCRLCSRRCLQTVNDPNSFEFRHAIPTAVAHSSSAAPAMLCSRCWRTHRRCDHLDVTSQRFRQAVNLEPDCMFCVQLCTHIDMRAMHASYGQASNKVNAQLRA